MHCNVLRSRSGSFKRFTSRSKWFLGIYSSLSVQEIHVTWNLIILRTTTAIRPYSVPEWIQYAVSNRIYFRSVFIWSFFLYEVTKSTTSWFISPDIRTFQLQNITTRHVIIQILMVLSMQNLEFESVMGSRSLMRHTLAWWPKTAGC